MGTENIEVLIENEVLKHDKLILQDELKRLLELNVKLELEKCHLITIKKEYDYLKSYGGF